MFLSVSATSRPPRIGEKDGVHYYYKTKKQFEEMIKNGELLEYNKYVNGNYYGTPTAPCEEHLQKGESIILEIDVEGGKQVKQKRRKWLWFLWCRPHFASLKKAQGRLGNGRGYTIKA